MSVDTSGQPQIDIAQHAVTRIALGPVQAEAKSAAAMAPNCSTAAMPSCSLLSKWWEETAFGDAGGRADIVNRAGGVALGAVDCLAPSESGPGLLC